MAVDSGSSLSPAVTSVIEPTYSSCWLEIETEGVVTALDASLSSLSLIRFEVYIEQAQAVQLVVRARGKEGGEPVEVSRVKAALSGVQGRLKLTT